MSHSVIIYDEENSSINPVFIRANGFLLNKYETLFSNQSTHTNKLILADLWLSEFKAVLVLSNETWKEIKFESENDKMMFLLRWG
jgi:hypothetical protein